MTPQHLASSTWRIRARVCGVAAATTLLAAACSTSPSPGADAGADAARGDARPPAVDTGPVPPSDPSYAACGGRIFDPATGALDPAEYERQARLWDRAAIDCRLGPTWAALHPGGAPDDRPTLFEPPADPARRCGGDGAFQTYEYGPPGCDHSCPGTTRVDYLSTSAQVVYEPDSPTAPGVDRLTTHGVAQQLVAVRPQFGPPRERSHPDEDLFSPRWPTLGFRSQQALAVSRSHLTGGYRGHQGLAVFEDGFVGGVGTITDGVAGSLEVLQVGFKFPDHLVPTDVAIAAHNELAFVTVWDTREHTGKLAVFAMHSNFPLHDLQTWWYIGLPSSGAFTGMKLLGYVDLPVRTPTSIAVATNGIQANGPHATGGMPLGAYGLVRDGACDPAVAARFNDRSSPPGSFADIVASHGYAIIASRWEHRVVLVDLAPLLRDLRRAYFEDMAFCNAHVAPAHVWTGASEGLGNNPGTRQFQGEDVWPYPFVRAAGSGPTLAPPVVAASFAVDAPIDVEAGLERNGDQQPRAFVLRRDGNIQVVAPERLFSFWPTRAPSSMEPRLGPLVRVCPHPTSLALANSNDSLLVACRGDRAVQSVSFDAMGGRVTREIRDARLDDPVAVEPNDRGPIWTVADFHGRRVVNYVLGRINFSCADVPLAMEGVVQRGGEMAIDGTPWLLSGANVN